MISKLSKEQEQQIEEYYNFYLSKGLSILPSNKSIAENAIKRMYKLMDKKEPKILWIKSLTELVNFIGSNKNSLENSLRNSLWNSLGNSLRNSLENSLGNSLENSLENSLGNSLRNSLENSLENSLWNSLWNSLGNSLRNSLENSLGNSLGNSLRNSLGNSLRNSLENSLRNSLWNSLTYGQINSNWISFYKYCNEQLGIKYNKEEQEKLNLWVDMMECSCFFIFKEIVILMEHPKELHVDDKGLNHNLSDYAIKWYDNTGIYVVHGDIVNSLNIEKLFKDKKITNLEYLEARGNNVYPAISR